MAGRPLTGQGKARAGAGSSRPVTSWTLVRQQEEKGTALSSGPLEAASGRWPGGLLILTSESPPRWAPSRRAEFSPSAVDLARGIWSLFRFQSRLWLSAAALGVPKHPQSCWAVPAPEPRSKTNGASRRGASRREPPGVARVARSPLPCQPAAFPREGRTSSRVGVTGRELHPHGAGHTRRSAGVARLLAHPSFSSFGVSGEPCRVCSQR